MFFADRIECTRVNRQPSNRRKFNRKPSKKVLFTVNRQKCGLILTVKTFQGISKNVTFSADLLGLLASEESGSKRE